MYLVTYGTQIFFIDKVTFKNIVIHVAMFHIRRLKMNNFENT